MNEASFVAKYCNQVEVSEKFSQSRLSIFDFMHDKDLVYFAFTNPL